MTEIKIIKPGDDYSDALKVRYSVFVKEQNIPEENEYDENDKISYHAVLYENEIPIACGRLYYEGNIAHIGRVAVLKEYRRKGYATTVCKKLMDIAKSIRKTEMITLGAQKYVVELYEKLGFKVVGKEYLDENIPHLKMEKIIQKSIFNKICVAVSITSWIMCILFFLIWKNSDILPYDFMESLIIPMTFYIGFPYVFIYSIFTIIVIYNLT